MQFTFQALGTTWWIEVFDDNPTSSLDILSTDIEDFANVFENRYSRFKEQSLVSTLNKERILTAPEEDCFKIFSYAKQLYIRSNARFNVLVGHILEERGYDPTYSFAAKQGGNTLAGNPISDLLVSRDEISITTGNVDFGGFGKGYLIDLLATRLQETYGYKYFFINGGGDMYTTSRQEEPVEIILEHPTQANTGIYKTTLLNQGFAASSPFKRRWKTATGETSHIVSETTVTQTANFIKATKASTADAFATTSLLMSPEEINQLAKTEQLGFAQFSPSTNQITGNKLFFG